MAKHFTKSTFDQDVIEASKTKPVLVDFFATWCGPCQLMGPIIDQLAETMADKAVVGKVDTEAESELAEKFSIMSIPTIMIFRDGQVKETLVGVQAKESLKATLEKYC